MAFFHVGPQLHLVPELQLLQLVHQQSAGRAPEQEAADVAPAGPGERERRADVSVRLRSVKVRQAQTVRCTARREHVDSTTMF